MADRPLLIFPIFNELDNGIPIVQANYAPNPDIKDRLGRIVIIQPFDRNMHENKVLEIFELPKGCVEEIRCYVVRRKNYMRVVIIFHEASEARATVLKCNRTSEHPDVCAIVAEDLLTRISQMEEEIKSKSCIKEMSQIIKYADYRKQSKTKLECKLATLFCSITPKFSIRIEDATKGIASIQVPSLSVALAAEFAFCGGMAKLKMFVILDRDSLHAQRDLTVRVSLIGHPDERRLAEQKSICEDNMNDVQLVFCNTLGCEACRQDPPERSQTFLSTQGIEEFSSCGESEEPVSSDESNTSECPNGNNSYYKGYPNKSSSDDKMCHDESSTDVESCPAESSTDVESHPNESSFNIERLPDDSSSDVEMRPNERSVGVKRFREENSSDAMTLADDTSSDSTL